MEIPDSPVPVANRTTSSSQRGSANPLNSIIRKWEAKFARHGGFVDEHVSSNGRNDGRYYEADEWLDDGQMEEDDGADEYREIDISQFRAIQTVAGEKEPEPEPEDEQYATDDEMEDDAGGNWQVLINRLETSKQPLVRELVLELEQVQAFPGHTKQKKQKSLRDCTARLRRLLPKVSQIQSQWQAAVWEVVSATNPTVTMQSFIDLWNDLSTLKQREEILKDREEIIPKLVEPVTEITSAWKRGESIMRLKHEQIFTQISRLWDLWIQEEECAGRAVTGVVPCRPISRSEKRFGAHLVELLPATADTITHFVRIALFGSRKTKKTTEDINPGPSDEDGDTQGGVDIHVVALPATIFIYKKNELLKCKLLDVKSLMVQTIQIVDKEWEAAGPGDSLEYNSFATVFESYQQKYVRKQDRVTLPTQYDAWKNFAVKIGQEYVNLYDIAQKAASLAHYGFTDKSGNPIFIPSIAAVRAVEFDKRKKLMDAKEERKRKREAIGANKDESKNPPLNDIFIPFPDFDKDLFKIEQRDVPTMVID